MSATVTHLHGHNGRSSSSDTSASASGSSKRGTGPDAQLAETLDAVRAHFATYVMTVTAGDLDILTLWTVHTHLCEETYTTPRLVLDSPVPGSGKTTVLEHIERIGMNPVQMSSVSSPALLVRMLDDGPRTILIDEVDRSLSPNKPGIEDIIAVLNSGYKRGASRPVLVPSKEKGWVAKEMPTFAPVAMAGNAPDLPDDTRSRCITVLLMPAGDDDELEETDWELQDGDARKLGERVAAAADAVRETVKANRPEVPKGCTGRAKERWLPLKRVAAAASNEWADRVDKLILDDLERDRLTREEGLQSRPPHVALLHDIASVLESGERFIETKVLIARLIKHSSNIWSKDSSFGKDLTAQRMGRMLVNHYRVHSWREPDGDRRRGYRVSAFAAPFRLMRVEGADRFNPTPADEPDVLAEPSELDGLCDVCRFPLTPSLGYTRHPDCEGRGSL